VTPLQLATAVATIANRGRVVRPRMVMSVDGGTYDEPAPLPPVSGVSADDFEQMALAMESVVHRNAGYDETGTAFPYIGKDIAYRMAGKSGTAQVVGIAQGQEYDENLLDERQRKHAWFVAFAPADAPRIALAVLVENGGGGSGVAAPVARQVIDHYLGTAAGTGEPSDRDEGPSPAPQPARSEPAPGDMLAARPGGARGEPTAAHDAGAPGAVAVPVAPVAVATEGARDDVAAPAMAHVAHMAGDVARGAVRR
jgi:penicillin-binding protein 2